MCGLAAVIATDTQRDVSQTIERLTASLAHRGPDGAGFWFFRSRSAALGHRRLSIVDLECGAQPMSNEDGTLWVILNGEIFNHLELRRELEALGHTFRTRADTEVLVHGWESWGSQLVERLNGMYAFLILDQRRKDRPGDLWLARDPVGVKPLYLGVSDGLWWASSELRAARDCGLLTDSLRPQAFDEYLVYRFVPSPGTFFPAAWSVPPGHLCQLQLDDLPSTPLFTRFQSRFYPTALPRNAGEWRDALRAGLQRAVERQLMADVPIGSLLSGGVDSTVITSLMRSGLAEPPQAFAAGISDSGMLDELPAARRSAEVLGVSLTELKVSSEQYLAEWPAQVAAMGEPIANPGLLLLGLLCRVVRRSRKVVLTGQGADEPLGGYPRHTAERFYRLTRRLQPLIAHLPESWAASDRIQRVRRVSAQSDEAYRFAEILAVFSPSEVTSYTGHRIDSEELSQPVRRWLSTEESPDRVNRLLFVDARLSLADDLLVVADHMSMASSVELRVPLLDLEFLALVERMPSRYKISPLGERKWLYRQAVGPLLPRAVRGALTGWRARTGRKLGFTTPLDEWFRHWVRFDAERYLLGPGARLPSYLRVDRVRNLLGDVRERGRPRSRQLLSLYVLEGWLRGTLSGPSVEVA